MRKNWGRRCGGFEPRCGICNAWKCFDYIVHPDKHDGPFEILRTTTENIFNDLGDYVNRGFIDITKTPGWLKIKRKYLGKDAEK